LIATAAAPSTGCFSVSASDEKSMPPVTIPSGGISRSLVNDATIFPNAPPITTPTAMSTTFPCIANSLNSWSIPMAWPSPG